MKRILLSLFPLVLLLLAGCSAHQDVTVDGTTLTLQPRGVPAATVTADGRFSVAGKPVELSPDAEHILQEYHQLVLGVHQDKQAVTAGARQVLSVTLKGVGRSLRNAVSRSSSDADASKDMARDLETTAQEIAGKATALCGKLARLQPLQAEVAERIDAFKPYARSNPAPRVNCPTPDASTAS